MTKERSDVSPAQLELYPRLNEKGEEVPQGVSMTQPGGALPLDEMLKRSLQGIPLPSVSASPNYDSDDVDASELHETVDPNQMSLMDIFDMAQSEAEQREREARLRRSEAEDKAKRERELLQTANRASRGRDGVAGDGAAAAARNVDHLDNES